jgi:hypothetical protein
MIEALVCRVDQRHQTAPASAIYPVGMMRTARRWLPLLVLILVAALLGACMSPEDTVPTLSPLVPTGEQATQNSPSVILFGTQAITPTMTTPIAATSDPSTLGRAAISLLAATLNVPEDSIKQVSITDAQWPDSSLGCPQPGLSYLQVLTAGYIITLDAGGVVYEVHADQQSGMVVCSSVVPNATATPPDPVAAEFIAQAINKLAIYLSVSPDAIVVISSEAADWLDTSLGCAEQSAAATPEIVSGYRIILAFEDQYYEFHTSFDRMVQCLTPVP